MNPTKAAKSIRRIPQNQTRQGNTTIKTRSEQGSQHLQIETKLNLNLNQKRNLLGLKKKKFN